MSFTIEYGDLFAHPAQALAHGVNCEGVIGGLASAMADHYPDAMSQYVIAARLGKLMPGRALMVLNRSSRWIIHCASQRRPGADATVGWLADSLADGLAQASGEGLDSVAVPLIGGGIGGLDPELARDTIAGVAEASPVVVTLVLPA